MQELFAVCGCEEPLGNSCEDLFIRPKLPPVNSPLSLPALHASHSGTWACQPRGEVSTLQRGEAVARAADTPHLILNAPLIAARLGYPDLSGLDLLELYAFVFPARFCVPTAKGLAEALGLEPPTSDDRVPILLQEAANALLNICADKAWEFRDGAWTALQSLIRLRWSWANVLTPYIKRPEKAERWLFSRLPEWEEVGERAQPRQITLQNAEVSAQLSHLTGIDAEKREEQDRYARAAARIFAPREARQEPNILLAQAGTGIGKTLGYLAPASLWAHASGGTVWVSTYTKNLQRQLRRESAKAWGAARADGTRPVVVRKGRENYLCLLNLEDALQGGFGGRPAILAQLVARWAAFTQDGDMIGGDLPGWLGTLFRARAIQSLSDQRGECVYAACPHYRKCFIEHAGRASADADLVIANHALMMVNAARGRDHAQRPTRMIFDEGHHVFQAADGVFCAALNGQELIEMRRWIIGPERGSKGRRRGLSARLSEIAGNDEASAAAISAAVLAAEAFPGEGWLQRIVEGEPYGALESLLTHVRALTFARDESANNGKGAEAGYSIETEIAELPPALLDAAEAAGQALDAIRAPLFKLGQRLEALLQDPPDWLDGQGRSRIEGARHSLGWRIDLLAAWAALLARLSGPVDRDFVDWFAVDRGEAREFDVGIYRHWLDPMKPFAAALLAQSHGVMLTSATLCDGGSDWENAIAESGARHIGVEPARFEAESPFNYAERAKVLIVTDLARGDLPALAGAYGRIIEASKGGVLGLFTAIKRLRIVYSRISDRLARAGLPLYAQHIDPIDTGTLIDIFRDDSAASLLGTDALRDGVDVPGHSLRCVVMEGVPWPKPSILHRARRMAAAEGGPNGGKAFDERIVRARLAQAFGRLIRSQNDSGYFVVLSSAFPSRLCDAFPKDTPILRVTLEEALQHIESRVFSDSNTIHHLG